MTPPRILVACIGNIFMGDDAFGVEAARRLALSSLPPGVTLGDFGIRGIDLAYTLLDPWDLVILVDACSRGGQPGDLYVIEAESVKDAPRASLDAHSLSPASVLAMVRSMGGEPGRILIVGCEPADLGPELEGKMGLSEPVAHAVSGAVAIVQKLIAEVPCAQPLETAARVG